MALAILRSIRPASRVRKLLCEDREFRALTHVTGAPWCQSSTNRNSQFEVWYKKLLSVQNSSMVVQQGCENSRAVRQLQGQVALGPCPS